MKASEQMVVHEADLDGALAAGGFLEQGRGSAFEGRPQTVVVLRATERGLGLLGKQVEQLVGRGFHAVVVSLAGVDKLAKPDAAARALVGAVDYADRFAGWLVVEARDAARRQLEPLGASLAFVRDREDALAAFRRREAEANGGDASPLVVESGDGTASSDDTTGPAGAQVDPNDWGWGTAEATAVLEVPKVGGDGLPPVDTAELLVEADELGRLRDKVDAIVKRGKIYVTLRLHFKRDRRMTSDDLAALVAARDRLQKAGGQLVLASLQEDLLKWLKLLDEDRHFLIVDSADDAETAHRRHAAGLSAPAAAQAEPAVSIVARDGKAVVIRPRESARRPSVRTTKAPVRVLVLGREGLPGLARRVELLAGEGVLDVVADLKRFTDIRGERFDAVPPALEAASKAGARLAFANVAREVKALLKILGIVDASPDTNVLADTLDGALLHLAFARHAASPLEEVRFEVATEELVTTPAPDPVSSSGIELTDVGDELGVAPTSAGGADPALRAQVEDLRQQLVQSGLRVEAIEAEREAAARAGQEAQRKAAELEQAKARAEREAREARGLLEAAQRDAARAKETVQRLEREVSEKQTQVLSGAQAELRARDAEAKAKELHVKLSERDMALQLAEGELADVQGKAQELEATAYRAHQLKEQVDQRDKKIADLEAKVAAAQAEAAAAAASAPVAAAESSAAAERAAQLEGQLTDQRASAAAADARARELQRKAEGLERELGTLRATAAAPDASAAADARARELQRQVEGLEKELAALRAKASAAEAGAGRARELEAKLAERERQLEVAGGRARALEAQVAERDRQVAAVEAKLAEAQAEAAKPVAGTGPSAADLERRVAELERDKARILTEAEQEIARLGREQEQLREELESAGEMIERLGKELEFS